LRVFVLLLILSICVGTAAYAQDKDFKQLRSEHFIISYEEGVSEGYASRVKESGEKFYKIITQDFGLIRDKLWLWQNRANIYIAKDKESYIKKFKCLAWAAACVDYQRKIIYTFADQSGFDAILAHELTHIIFREYVGSGGLPLWLEEGIATYMGQKHGAKYGYDISFLKNKMKNDEYIKLADLNRVTQSSLSSASQDYLNLFYTESLSIVNFIINQSGKYGFSNFLSYLKKGNSLEEALSKAFYKFRNLEELERQWKKFYLG
jgi:hypothetical protein